MDRYRHWLAPTSASLVWLRQNDEILEKAKGMIV